MINVSRADVSWRSVDDGALIVHRTSAAMWHLNPAATVAWQSVVAAGLPTAPTKCAQSSEDAVEVVRTMLSAHQRDGRTASRLRRVADIADVIAPIQLARAGFVRHVGDGVLWCAPDGRVCVFSGDTAAIWDRLALGPASFVTLSDLVCDRFELGEDEGERRTAAALADLNRGGAVEGLDQLVRFRPSSESIGTRPDSEMRGRLETMEPSRPPRGAFPGVSPVLGGAARSRPPAHVAIVCQYGIAGLAPGVDDYVQRCIKRLELMKPDLVILSGGGRHGLATVREAESVIARYRAQLPGQALWLDRHSETTWENLQNSLEMLAVSSIVPRRISFVGDRARAEKLRLCCWLAKRRFTSFSRVAFRVVPLRRVRFTWRDRRGAQLVAGCLQAIRDYRSAPPAIGMQA